MLHQLSHGTHPVIVPTPYSVFHNSQLRHICTIHASFVVILSDSECSLDCQNGGNCIEETDVYRCRCPGGYLGIYCETEINECDSNPCVHGNCSDMINAFSCNCSAGFAGLHCECTSIAMRYFKMCQACQIF